MSALSIALVTNTVFLHWPVYPLHMKAPVRLYGHELLRAAGIENKEPQRCQLTIKWPLIYVYSKLLSLSSKNIISSPGTLTSPGKLKVRVLS